MNGKEVCETPMYEIAEQVGSVFQNPRTQFFNVDTDSEIAFGIENEALPWEKLHERLDQTTSDLKLHHLEVVIFLTYLVEKSRRLRLPVFTL